MDVDVIIKTEAIEIKEDFLEVEKVDIKNEFVETVVPVPTKTTTGPSCASVYICRICKKVFGVKDLFEHHLKVVHRPLTVNILSGAFCDMCKKILDENIYDAHLPQCLTNYNTVPICSTLQRYSKKFECNICRKASINLNRLSEHLRTVHRPITINYAGKSTHSYCDTCKSLFKDDLFTHFPCNAVDVKCFFCLMNMPLKSHFVTHNLYWQGFRKFQCNICTVDTQLMNFNELNEHMKQHNGLGVFQCIKCSLHMNQSDLEKHYEMHHHGCKCVANPCTCDKYNEYFYIKNILKIDIPFGSSSETENKFEFNNWYLTAATWKYDLYFEQLKVYVKSVPWKNYFRPEVHMDTQKKQQKQNEERVEQNVKSTVDTQNKSIQTSTTIQISKIKVACKNCGPPKLPIKTYAKKENKSEKICSKPELPNSFASKTTSKTKNTSIIKKENSSIEFGDIPALTVEELLQKDTIDKESFLRTYFDKYQTNIYMRPQKIQPNKRLTRHQLKIYRGLLIKQAQLRAREKGKQTNTQLKRLNNSKTVKTKQNTPVFKQEEIMCSDIVKEEHTEFMDSDTIKNEIDPLLEEILSEKSQRPVNFKEKSVPPMLPGKKKSQNEETNNKKIKYQSYTENTEFGTTNNSVNSRSAELNYEQSEDSIDSFVANISANEDQQEDHDKEEEEEEEEDDDNSEDVEEPYKVYLVNIDDKNEDTQTDNSTSKNETKTSEDQTSLKINLFQDLESVADEQSSNNSDPDYLPNFKTTSALAQINFESSCNICFLKFPNVDLLNNHLVHTHNLRAAYVKRYMTRTVYCAVCKMYTTQNHFSQCKGAAANEICYFCNMGFPKRDHFDLHNVKFFSYNKMFCTLCDDQIEYKIKSLNEHRIKEHNEVGVFECVICKEKFPSNNKLKTHLVYSKHKFNIKKSAKTYKLLRNHCEALKYFKCQECDKIFFSHQFFSKHTCQNVDLCFICGQTFKRSTYLKEHLNTHLKTQSYNCKICDKKFVSRKHMIQHQKIHETNKKFNCLECPQTFTQQTSLIYHMATHTKENVFKCSVCDILFDKQSKLTAHMKIHNENGTNPHKCEVCKKFFSHKCNLLVHQRTHREYNETK